MRFVRSLGSKRWYSATSKPVFDASRPVASINVDWTPGSTAQFLGTDASGNKIMMSGSDEPGIGPMKMLLMAVGGCAAVDLVSILKKQRQAVEGVHIRVEGQRTTEHPRPFDKIHATFEVSGSKLDAGKVQRAVELAIEKYCGVHASLSHGVPITWGSDVVDAATKKQ
ncbi:hypothetical protein HDU67_009452 [Dinochytrium kinnereticum]|nr:hypothetical protein HDU67_009452 [Dinochytrium kinnereticum]